MQNIKKYKKNLEKITKLIKTTTFRSNSRRSNGPKSNKVVTHRKIACRIILKNLIFVQ
jgi:hypothetical protein